MIRFLFGILFSFYTITAESLWRDKDPYSVSKTFRPGTVVKVVLKQGVKVDYETEYKATFDSDVKTVPDKKIVSDVLPYTHNSTYMRSKVGKSKTGGKILGVLAVLVTGIDPGTGNLELEGSKSYELEEEKLRIRLTGTVSPEDLDANRLVSSDSVANLRVVFEGTLTPKSLKEPNIELKRKQNPDGSISEKAELSDIEKQEILLKNIKRVLGESE